MTTRVVSLFANFGCHFMRLLKPSVSASFDARRLFALRKLYAQLLAAGDAYALSVEPDLRRVAACLIAGVQAEA